MCREQSNVEQKQRRRKEKRRGKSYKPPKACKGNKIRARESET